MDGGSTCDLARFVKLISKFPTKDRLDQLREKTATAGDLVQGCLKPVPCLFMDTLNVLACFVKVCYDRWGDLGDAALQMV